MNRNFKFAWLLAALVAISVTACNNNKGRGTNTAANVGAIPTTTCLLSPNGYQGQCNYNYSAYQGQGFTSYDYTLYSNGLNNNYANGFCGCGQNGFPVYSNNWGLGCINNSLLQGGYGLYGGYNTSRFLMYNWNAYSMQWTFSQQNYTSGYYTCSNSVILACDTGAQGSCGPYGYCQSTSPYGGSGYSSRGPGICVMNQNVGYGNYPYGY